MSYVRSIYVLCLLGNITKSTGNCGFVHICGRNLWWKTTFFAQCENEKFPIKTILVLQISVVINWKFVWWMLTGWPLKRSCTSINVLTRILLVLLFFVILWNVKTSKRKSAKITWWFTWTFFISEEKVRWKSIEKGKRYWACQK